MRRLVLAGLALVLVACPGESTSSSPAEDTSTNVDGEDDAGDAGVVEDEGPGTEDAVPPEDLPDEGTDPIDATETPPDAVTDASDSTDEPDATDAPGPCAELEEGEACDTDGDLCSLETCVGGVCTDKAATEDCAGAQAQQPCWTFTCNAKAGCTPTVFVEGGSCDDGNPCTHSDTCQTLDFKACVGTPLPIDDDNPCTDDACMGGTVTHTPLDGIPCTLTGQPGMCLEGECVIEDPCTPVNGGWTPWVYGACSEPCDGGVQGGTRSCTNPVPACGGGFCEGPDTKTQPCNTAPCGGTGDVASCPSGLPFGENPVCLAPASTGPLSKVVSSGFAGDSYGVKLVAGPGNTVAALYKQKEWFERMGSDGTLILPAVSLPEKNPAVQPSALGDSGFPAFYGPTMAFDGTVFGIGRSGKSTGNAYFYSVDELGNLVDGPLTIVPPGAPAGQDRGPALEQHGGAWYLAWQVSGGTGSELLMARITPEITLDGTWAADGILSVGTAGGTWHPEIAISGDGAIAAVVWGNGQFGLALIDLASGTVKVSTPPLCPGGSSGSNGDGHDVVWNAALGEFGVLQSGQGKGLCSVDYTSVNATLMRVSTAGDWIGSPLPVLCGYPIGAGFRGGVAAYPDGRYAVAMTRYHTKPFCVEGFPNGSQGVASFDFLTVNAADSTLVSHKTFAGTPSVYSQTDLVWTGTHMSALTGKGISAKGTSWMFE